MYSHHPFPDLPAALLGVLERTLMGYSRLAKFLMG